MSFELLTKALRELEEVLDKSGVKLIVGGGFGLFLLQNELMKDRAVRTVIDREFWCVPRATFDIDIILETNIVASIDHFLAIQESLDRLGYRVKTGVEYLHFDKKFSETETVEINFLTGPIEDSSTAERIKISRPRVRPRGDNVRLHAYLTDEAIGISSNLQPVSAFSNLYLPASVTFLIMKLHAFRDRFEAAQHEKAGHHAMDVYRVVSMLTERAYAETSVFLKSNKGTPAIMTASEIVKIYFREADMPGLIKIREHPLYRAEFKMDEMRSILSEMLD